jgi:hypothetical protein
LVILGEPQPLSKTALRPRGPSVLRTALANLLTPANNGARASSSNTICFATFQFLLKNTLSGQNYQRPATARPDRLPAELHDPSDMLGTPDLSDGKMSVAALEPTGSKSRANYEKKPRTRDRVRGLKVFQLR